MKSAALTTLLITLASLGLSLTACSGSDSGTADAVAITAPAGDYAVDPNHSSVSFEINHLGLSTYVARFTEYDINLKLDPENPSGSSVSVSIAADSVRTDYSGDYKATHQKSPYSTWDEDLAQSPKFLNAGKHPRITFQSTRVKSTAVGRYEITGDLNLLGITQPVTLQAHVVGSVPAHPFTNLGAIGFSATGKFNRSAFGMNHLLSPPLIGDEVTLRFEGEFQQLATTGE